MSRRLRLVCMSTCAVVAILAARCSSGWAQPPQAPKVAVQPKGPDESPAPAPKSAGREAEERIREALSKPVKVDFDETPLKATARLLQDSCGIPILLDMRALEEAQIEPSVRVSLQVSEISLRSVLRLMLRELELTYMIRRDVLTITTPDEAERHLSTRVYPVGDIIARHVKPGEASYDFDAIVEGIASTVAPETWDDVGGPGSISVADFVNVKALVITQTDDVHEQVAVLLAALRSLAQQAAHAKLSDPLFLDGYWPTTPAKEAIRKALEAKVSLEFIETPLRDVAGSLGQAAHVNVVLDRKALAEVGIPVDTPMSIHVAEMTLERALRLMLRRLDLTYVVRDEVIMITTPEEAEMRLPIGFYLVGDLVARRDDSGQLTYDYNRLTDLITSTILPDTWNDVGGPGSVGVVQFEKINALAIGQSHEAHQQIADLLAVLRKLAREAGQGTPVDAVMFGMGPAEKRIAEQLKAPTELKFTESPLQDVIDALKRMHKIEIQIDHRALNAAGTASDTRITKDLRGISLCSALESLLEPLDLAWVISDEILLITTPEEAEMRLSVGFYPVGDLMVSGDENGKPRDDYDALIRAIMSAVAADTWDQVGGPGRIAPATFGDARLLVVSQTMDVHQRISEFLEKLRRVAAGAGDSGRPPRRGRPEPVSAPGRPGSGRF